MLLRRSLLLAAPAVLGVAAGCALGRNAASNASDAPARAVAKPLTLPELPPGSRLESLGALVLDDSVLGFGGLSSLHLSDALEVTSVSDVAHWMQARLVLDGMRPVGLADLRTGPLRDGIGRPLPRGFTSDSESLARRPDGTWLVGFERWHRIRAYPDLNGPGGYVEVPQELAEAPGNGGLESLAVLADGNLLLIAEAWPPADDPTARRLWLGRPGASWRRLAYRPENPKSPCDATPMPDGGALVLERSFSVFGGFRGRLTRLSPAQLRDAAEGTVLEGEEWLRLEPPLPTDNYEGVAMARYGGRTLLALVSDDNQNMLQRTLLLLFALADE